MRQTTESRTRANTATASHYVRECAPPYQHAKLHASVNQALVPLDISALSPYVTVIKPARSARVYERIE